LKEDKSKQPNKLKEGTGKLLNEIRKTMQDIIGEYNKDIKF
jgi:hypothetical protein